MKFLFIVQGEGRGHLTQAITLEEILRRNGHEVVEVLVGKSNSRKLPGFFNRNIHAPVKRFISPNFLPTASNKRVDMPRSIAYNLLRVPAYYRSICYIKERIRVSGADMVINFYELLTGLTYLFFSPRIPYVCIGHQYLFLHREFIFPKKNRMSIEMLKFFTQMTSIGARECLALSFYSMEDDVERHIKVIPPLLRKDVLLTESKVGDYIHGYMVNAGFGENVLAWHEKNKSVPMHFFWDKPDEPEVKHVDDTLAFQQLNDVEFLRRMASCKAYATTAGFESVCEAMFLGKPLMMVPAHIEQDCNAHDAIKAGAGIVCETFDLKQLIRFAGTYCPNRNFIYWVRSSERRIIFELEQMGAQNPATTTIPTFTNYLPI